MIASNHASFLDPPFIGAAISTRCLRYMARHTLFKNRLFAVILDSLGAFPIKRDAVDREAWRIFKGLISGGEAVVVFPEGTRTETGELQDGKPGMGMLVYQTNAMVVPVYVDTFGVWSKGKRFPSTKKEVSIIFGKPIMPLEGCLKTKGRQAYEATVKRVMQEIKKLKEDLEKIKKQEKVSGT